MKDLAKVVLLLIAGGCFLTISYFTFIDPKLTTQQFMNLVFAGMATVVIIGGLYLFSQHLRK